MNHPTGTVTFLFTDIQQLSRFDPFGEDQPKDEQSLIQPNKHGHSGNKKSILKNSISGYDLFVASGGGYMCDHDKWLLLDLFDRLEAAIEQGIPTVMVGPGLGPMNDPELLARARAILASVDLILFRNQRLGQPLLDFLGIQPERTIMTGDDAIELAYNARQKSLASGRGVSLTVSSYTRVKQSQLETLRSVLHKAGREHQAELIAVPISSAPHESDISHIRRVHDRYDRVFIDWRKLGTPMTTIKKVGRCRLMVVGTYHGAIFSLAQASVPGR